MLVQSQRGEEQKEAEKRGKRGEWGPRRGV